MKLILDTNVWYNLPKDDVLKNTISKLKVSPTLLNISELCQTRNMLDKTDEVREALRSMFPYQENAILQTPFSYLSNLNGCEWEQKDLNVGNILRFVETIARGGTIAPEKETEYRSMVENLDLQLEPVCEWMNNKASEI